MQDKTEDFIKNIYRNWKSGQQGPQGDHPDDEEMADFIEGRLSGSRGFDIKAHLISCGPCLEKFILSSNISKDQPCEVPAEALEKIRHLCPAQDKDSIFEIMLKLKDKIIEIVSTTGDVLVGQEFVPAPVLRSRSIKDFKDQVTILKDMGALRVEVKVENKVNDFNLIVLIRDKFTHKVIKDLRVALFKEECELESYVTGLNAVVFEHVLLGRYKIEVGNIEEKLASVSLEIKA